jgi:polynucleotide 5'-hydroxyl-kinase GRC3/NOL9
VSPAAPFSADASWAAAVARAREARIVLVLGGTDTGKTSLVTYLAGALLAGGRSVAVVDADLGQSEIGPPTTVGVGRLRGRFERLADAEVAGLYFVGATSPCGRLVETVLGTQRMTERALQLGVDCVLVDTCGLVLGEFGRRLKQAKIDLVAPDLVVCLQREGECEPILRPYAGGRPPAIVRMEVSPAARRRSPDERRQHRERAMQAYLGGARPVTLDLGRVVLREPALYAGAPLSLHETEALAARLEDAVLWAERRGPELALVTPGRLTEPKLRALAAGDPGVALASHSLDDFRDVVAGLEDGGRETLGLGVVRRVDFTKRAMVVETSVPEATIAGVRLGRHRVP